MWGKGIEEVREEEGMILESCVGYVELSLESDGRNQERCIHLVCDLMKMVEGFEYIVLHCYCTKCGR
jgi:hypothetical protein